MRLGDLDALKERINIYMDNFKSYIGTIKDCSEYSYARGLLIAITSEIDNAPTVEINTNDIEHKAYCKGLEDGKKIARPKGECCGSCYLCDVGDCKADLQKGGGAE